MTAPHIFHTVQPGYCFAEMEVCDVRTLMCHKHGQNYVVQFDARHKAEAIVRLGRWASDHRLTGFVWQDAAIMSQRIRGYAKGVTQ